MFSPIFDLKSITPYSGHFPRRPPPPQPVDWDSGSSRNIPIPHIPTFFYWTKTEHHFVLKLLIHLFLTIFTAHVSIQYKKLKLWQNWLSNCGLNFCVGLLLLPTEYSKGVGQIYVLVIVLLYKKVIQSQIQPLYQISEPTFQ